MADFRMPVLGADMTEGTVVEYLVEVGRPVRKGEPLAVIDTEKAAIEVEAQDSGTLAEIVVPVGEQVPVGTLLAVIASGVSEASDDAGGHPEPEVEAVVEAQAQAGRGPEPAGPTRPAAPPPPPPPPPVSLPAPRPPEPAVASPLVRHLAHQNHIDLAHIVATGPRGVVTRGDVEHARTAARRVRASPYARARAAALGVDLWSVQPAAGRGVVHAQDVEAAAAAGPAKAPAASPVAPIPASPIPVASAVEAASPAGADMARARRQAAVAALMARSKREIPHFYVAATMDCGPLLDWIAERNSGRPIAERLLPVAGLLRAVVRAVAEVPDLNGYWRGDGADPRASVDLGVAISLRDGSLVAPCLPEAQSLSVDELMAGLRAVVRRARQGRLTSSDARPPTITVTNLGELGVEAVLPIIYPPQLAMVGLGRIVRRPWAVASSTGEALAVRPVVTVTAAVDHRAVNGHAAGRFLSAMEHALSTPDQQ